MSRFVRLRAAVLSLALAIPVALAACAAPGSGDDSKKSTEGPIKIALVDAQSGQLSSLGAWELKGARLAVDEWNKAVSVARAENKPVPPKPMPVRPAPRQPAPSTRPPRRLRSNRTG